MVSLDKPTSEVTTQLVSTPIYTALVAELGDPHRGVEVEDGETDE